jgi:hypothetical protein
MNKNNTMTPAIVAILMIATLVVGVTLAATMTTSAFAGGYKKGKQANVGKDNNGSNNGNTNNIEIQKQKAKASGKFSIVDQNGQNVICTHLDNNVSCSQQGTTVPTPPPEPTTGTLLVKKVVVCMDDGSCPIPSDFTLAVFNNNNDMPSVITGSTAGTSVTLIPGTFRVAENTSSDIEVSRSGDCEGTIAAGDQKTCTVKNTKRTPPADTQPPQVLSFTVEPMRVSLSSDGGTITITAHVADATGVQRVGVFIQDQCGGSPGFFQSLPLSLVSGTPQEGIYQSTFTFPASALNINRDCTSDAAFQVGGLTVDTLGNQEGLPLINFVILTP